MNNNIFNNNIMNAICLITNKPNTIFLTFLNTFTAYDVFIIIDDNSKSYNNLKPMFPRLNIIQMPNSICVKSGIQNTNFITFKKPITGWDKAIYYFSIYCVRYNYVWFIEDDVFFNSEKTLLDIDNNYKNADLLCNSDLTVATNRKHWLWRLINMNLPPPYVNGMMCACRMSVAMLQRLKEYGAKNKTLFFLEALFPTIAVHHKLSCMQPDELKSILYRNYWDINTLNAVNLYHPIKKIEDHLIIRNRLDKIDSL